MNKLKSRRRGPAPEGAGGAKQMRRYTATEKLRAVRLHLEAGFAINPKS